MILARILNECEDDLICDLAETYHILNLRELSPCLVAVLSLGLRDDSRVKMHFSKTKITLEQALLARMSDCMSFLAWSKTKDAQKGRRYKEKSILKELLMPEKKEDLMLFESVEDFDSYMKRFER